VKYDQIVFTSGGDQLDGWHFTGVGDAFAGPAGRPVVVMAHGLGGTKDSGLEPFATGLAEAGLDVLAFDYRGFGASGGTPRQRASMAGQVEDYRAALAAAARLPGVDARRLVLWGVSLAGGHVLAVGAGRDDVAAVIALTPLVDGIAAGRLAMRHHAPSSILRSTVAGVRSRVSSVRGAGPVTMPIVARPGEVGALSLPGHYESYTAIAGPTWRNEIDAAVGLELGGHRPGKQAKHLRCPLLVQIADFDRSAPPHAAARAAEAGRAEVRHYPCDHFDVWPGSEWFEPVAEHQVMFLRHHLA
jgi:pimeloyl-ACP methyl ester carboxylesterase